jgi:shikimate kinase
MKSLIVVGVPRAGKSSLANMLCDKLKYGLISIDAIVSTFAKVFPELGMHVEPELREKIAQAENK